MPRISAEIRPLVFVFTLLILTLGQVFVVSIARAETATEQEARTVAQNWLNLLTSQQGAWADETQPGLDATKFLRQDGLLLAYCVPVLPRGYIVVPVLKEMAPVKVSSDDADLDPDAPGGMAALLREVLGHRARLYIDRYGSLEAAQPSRGEVMFDRSQREEWDRFLKDPMEFARESSLEKSTEVGPLLTSSWHQSAPFNNACPPGDGGTCLVGCVATAASQVMQFHQWPPEGLGNRSYYWSGDDSCGNPSTTGSTLIADFSDSYDWPNILDHAGDMTTQAQWDAVAEQQS